MSAFYLDILKDRVYTSKTDSLERRSAQTVMYQILDTLVRLMAPVLSFTADEVWRTCRNRRRRASIWPNSRRCSPEWKDDVLVERWERIIKVRADVSKALELARVPRSSAIPWMPPSPSPRRPNCWSSCRDYER